MTEPSRHGIDPCIFLALCASHIRTGCPTEQAKRLARELPQAVGGVKFRAIVARYQEIADEARAEVEAPLRQRIADLERQLAEMR